MPRMLHLWLVEEKVFVCYYKNKNTKQNTNKLVTTNYDIDLSVGFQFLWQ